MNDGIYPPEFRSERPHVAQDEMNLTEARVLFWKRFTIFCGVVILILCLGTVTVSVVLIRSTQVSGRPILVEAQDAAQQSRAGTERILDCTTPGKKCYEDSQMRLARQVAALVGDNRRAAAAASACAVQLAPRLATVDPHTGFLLVRSCQRHRLAGQ